MTALVITAPETTTAATFVKDAEAGNIQFHNERTDGTTRRVHYLTGTRYEDAVWVQVQREEGRSMRSISNELHLSIPTVRRMLNDLALTEAIKEAEQEELEEMLTGAREVNTTTDQQDEDLPKTTEEFVQKVVETLS
jgi:hypothetical protein